MGSNSKGDANERELVNHLDDDGWVVMRAPASGSATERELPDVLAGRDGVFIAVECKRSGDDVVYIDEEEVEALEYFADNFGAVAQLSIRFDEEYGDPSYAENWPGQYFLRPSDCHRTSGGNYRIKKELALESGVPVGPADSDEFYDHMEYDYDWEIKQ